MLDNKGFDLWSDDYDKSVGLSDDDNTYPFAGYREILNQIYNEVLYLPAKKILDVGFGTGTLTSRLYEKGIEIYGQDFSEEMLKIAQEKMPDAHLYSKDFSDGLSEELLANKYDAIIATYSLHHLEDEDKVDFIKLLFPLLDDGGKILIGDVAFRTRHDLEICKNHAGDYWDYEEFYFVYDEIKDKFPTSTFDQMSHCAGIIIIEN
ncbi:class I SAM-dependent methyltransferase [Anaerococcus urinomassiliensis]|uniref:class I SAM-dependent methyltransferase n=1 Tax=Anaerococcus urinomassiliensis TaxID=1745712 RepID=UPI00093EFC58|nr:class I SAM-dependent methyltransferase [Anaerococcus urinomassiliensis]